MEKTNNRIRIIWDDCTAIAERRPTNEDDIKEDFHIKNVDNKEELLNTLLNIYNMDSIKDIEEDDNDNYAQLSIDEQIDIILHYYEDMDEGSPNIIYLNINGEEKDVLTYNYLHELDLNNISEKDLIDFALKNDPYIQENEILNELKELLYGKENLNDKLDEFTLKYNLEGDEN